MSYGIFRTAVFFVKRYGPNANYRHDMYRPGLTMDRTGPSSYPLRYLFRKVYSKTYITPLRVYKIDGK